MRILVFIPLILFQFLFINPFGLDNHSYFGVGNQHVTFKKYDSEKSPPVLIIEEEVEDSEDSEDESRMYSRQSILLMDCFSFYSCSKHSFRSGLFSSINSLNLRNLGIELFHLNRNLRL